MSDINTAEMLASGNLRSPKGRLSYPALFTPRSNPQKPGDEPRFSTSILFPPTADLKAVRDEIKRAATEKWGNNIPPKFKTPLLKAEELYSKEGTVRTYPEEFDGWIVVRCWTKRAPGIVDNTGKPITEEKEVYAGRWAALSLRCYAYSAEGNFGCGLGLQNVQILDHDTPMAGGAARAEDEFAPVKIAGGDASAVFADGDAPKEDIFG